MYSNKDVASKWRNAAHEANTLLRGNSANSRQIDQLRECVSLLKEAVRKRKELQKAQQSTHETVEFTIPAVQTHNEEEDAESKSVSSDEAIESEATMENEVVESEVVTENEVIKPEVVIENEVIKSKVVIEDEVIESEVVTEKEVIESERVTEDETEDSESAVEYKVIDIEMVTEYEVIGLDVATDNESSPLEPDDESIEVELITDDDVEITELMITVESSVTRISMNEASNSQEASTDEESEISLKNQTLDETPEQIEDSSSETPPNEETQILHIEEERYTCYQEFNLEGGIQRRRMILAAHPIGSSTDASRSSDEETPME